ncbi:MAG: hypothetical protein IT196_18530 [Acidimicrobiales bacterium]|nr:hypothetical protein [Acidimicrobiales bacterium]
MTVALLAVLVVLLAGGGLSIALMRRHADPRRSGGAASLRTIDPFAVNEPWRRFVQDALRAQNRFGDAIAGAAAGPLRERLLEIGRSLDAGVERTWATARQGQTLRDARRRIDTNQVNARLASFRTTDDPNAANTVASLEAQLASAERLDAVTREAESKLRLLQAQLDEAVARAAELSVRAGDVGELAGVEHDIAEVTDQLEALRLALEETNQVGGGAGGGIPQADH